MLIWMLGITMSFGMDVTRTVSAFQAAHISTK